MFFLQDRLFPFVGLLGHSSQRPPLTLNEKRPALKPRIWASGVISNSLRMSEKTFE